MSKITEAIILSAGEGKRLGHLSEEIPKALVKVNNRFLIDYQIEWLKKYGVENIILTLNKKYCEITQRALGNRIKYSSEETVLGTAGGIKNVLSKNLINSERFFVINVDDLTDIDLYELAEKGANTISLAKMRSPYGVVHTKGDFVERFEEKPLLNVWVNCGAYLLNKDIHNKLPNVGDFERDVFPHIKLRYYKHYGKWNTVNTQKDAEELGKIIIKGVKK